MTIEKNLTGTNHAGDTIYWDRLQCTNLNCNKIWIKPVTKKCKFNKGWCQTCGKSKDRGLTLCFYDDPFWNKI